MKQSLLYSTLVFAASLAAPTFSENAESFKKKHSGNGNYRILRELKRLKSELNALTHRAEMDINCDEDPDALQAAIDSVSLGGADIYVSGVCNPVAVMKDNITIDGMGVGTIMHSGPALFTFYVNDADNVVLSNMNLDNQFLTGASIFTEKANLTLSNIIGINGSAAIFLDGSNITIDDELTLDGVIISALGSSVDAKIPGVVTTPAFIGATNSSLYINDTLNTSGGLILTQGSTADITIGNLNTTGGILVDGNAVLSIANSSIVGDINVGNNASFYYQMSNILDETATVNVSTNASFNWATTDEFVNTINCTTGGVSLVNGDPTMDLCTVVGE